MNNIRVKFYRGEEVKYISHLDMMKLFERALRRSDIPIAYSQGFNPHPHLVFGLPLSVGVSSESEYADFELAEKVNPNIFTERLNKDLPKGLSILDAKEKTSKDNIMASIRLATYDILVSSSKKMKSGELNNTIKRVLQLPAITAKKEGKKGLKDIDIKPMIHSIEVKMIEDYEEESTVNKCTNTWLLEYYKKLQALEPGNLSFSVDNVFCLSARLSAGSVANLKPELLVTAIHDLTELEIKLVKVHRTGLFIEKGGEILDPLDDRALS